MSINDCFKPSGEDSWMAFYVNSYTETQSQQTVQTTSVACVVFIAHV